MSKTYCTYRIKVANRERVEVEKWNSLHQSLGEPSGVFRYGQKLGELTPLLSSALNNELNDSSRVRALGETLFDILFDDVLRQDFVSFYEQVIHRDKQLLRIELVIDEQGMPEVAALPWEFMCLPERANLGSIWLSTAPEVVFSRRRSQYFEPQPIQLQKNEKLRIAFIVASPPGLPPIAYEPIQEALEKLAQEKAELIELLPVLHSADLESVDEMLQRRPHIVHFMGHCGLQDEQGKEVGVIALVDPDVNQVLWVEAGNFSELLNQHRPGLVILQASQSGRLSASQAFAGVASRVVQQNIPVVVAMQYDVSDLIASRFASRFYRQLAEGDPVDIATQYGRRAISLSAAQYKKRDFATPIIFMRVEDGYLFQSYKEEPAPPLPYLEMRRRLEAAMPQQCQADRPTEVRVMVALHDSPGLRATLPDVTESGDLINKNDAVHNEVALEFPVDSKTQEPLPINVFVSITALGFKIEQSAKSIRVSPKYDSGIITFFLTPAVPQKYGRVVVEWFGDEQKNTLLGSLTLFTEIVDVKDLSNIVWEIKKYLLTELKDTTENQNGSKQSSNNASSSSSQASPTPAKSEELTRKQVVATIIKLTQELPNTNSQSMYLQQRPKRHGCVKAEFIVENVPDELRFGIFQELRCYDAWIRFANGLSNVQSDTKGDVRSMAIKLLDVHSEKLLKDERNAETQDFILINHPVFFLKDAQDVQAFSKALLATNNISIRFLKPLPFLLMYAPFHRKQLSILKTIRQKQMINPLQTQYWSAIPYRFGPYVVKFAAVPHSTQLFEMGKKTPKSDNFLQESMIQQLTHQDVYFDFMVQLQTDKNQMPIEDATIEWNEIESPFIKLATIRIPKQHFNIKPRQEYDRLLSFNSWNTLPVHTPLSSVNSIIYTGQY